MYFVFHGSLDNGKSIGTNNLIKEFAKIVTEPEDILKEYGLITESAEEKEKKLIDESYDIPEEYREIYQIIKDTPVDVNEIVRQGKFNLKEVMQKLTMLELEGRVRRVSGNRYIREE